MSRQADVLRAIRRRGRREEVPAAGQAEIVLVESGGLIPGSGIVVDGLAMVDESAITGESAPVLREPGGDRSHVVGGTRVLTGRISVALAGHRDLAVAVARPSPRNLLIPGLA